MTSPLPPIVLCYPWSAQCARDARLAMWRMKYGKPKMLLGFLILLALSWGGLVAAGDPDGFAIYVLYTIAAVVVAYALTWIVARFGGTQDPLLGKDMVWHFEEEQITLETGTTRAYFQWANVEALRAMPEGYFFMMASGMTGWLPFGAFEDQAQRQALAQMVEQMLDRYSR